MTPDGGEVQAIDEGAEGEADSHEGEEHVDEGDAGGENCHFHAGVELVVINSNLETRANRSQALRWCWRG